MTENTKKFMELVSANKELGMKVNTAQKDMLIIIANLLFYILLNTHESADRIAEFSKL